MLPSIDQVRQLIHQYISRFPSEKSRTESILDFVSGVQSDEDLYFRKNFVGHLTASAFVLSADKENILLLHHKTLNRWLQPGGHIDADDTDIYSASLREVSEETGIHPTQLSLAIDEVFDIDSHHIPANPRKGEDAHIHHDIRYLFVINKDQEILINQDESNAAKWLTINEFSKLDDFKLVAQKIFDLI